MVALHSPRNLPAGESVAFLHRLDGIEGEAEIVNTDRGRLRAASFLDGREPFWSGKRLVSLDLGGRRVPPASRFVFHTGFCGSTLLARLLDRPGKVLSLKEPQCLADIAGQHAMLAAGQGVAPLGSLIDHTLQALGAAGEPELRVVIKPTNWVNVLLPELCAPGRIAAAVFVSMDRRAYVGAVFRGGRDRIAFCSRLAAAVAPVLPNGERLLGEAVAGADAPLDRAARLTALLHAMQEALFDRAIAANRWSADARIDFAHLAQHPAAVLRRARRVLGLDIGGEDDARAFDLMDRHTKDPASPYDPGQRLRNDQEIERHHAQRFDAALDWITERAGELA